MNDVALVGLQVRYEQKQFWRNPPSAFFAVVFPLVFLVLFSSVFANQPIKDLGNVNREQYFVPAILAFGVFGATFTNLAVSLSIRRDNGVLKRLRSMPLPAWVYLAGVIGNAVIVATILVVVTTLAGVVFYGVTWEGRWLGLAIDVLAGAVCFSALGLMVCGLISDGDAATPIVQAIVIPLSIVSGNFGYIDQSSALSRLAQVFPLKHFNQTVFAAFDPRASGVGANATDILVLLAWGAGASVVALRVFRWTPAAGADERLRRRRRSGGPAPH